MTLDPGQHAVQFYERDDSLARSLASFFAPGTLLPPRAALRARSADHANRSSR